MARRYVRDNRGRFASTGATARGGRLKTAAGGKRQGQTMRARSGPSGVIGKNMPQVMTREQYIARHGGGAAYNSQMIGPGGRTRMSKKQLDRMTKTAQSRDAAERQANQKAGDRYDRLVARGKVRPPSPLEALQRKAQGHSDNASVQAAQRVLAKREARMRAGQPAPKSAPKASAPSAAPASPAKRSANVSAKLKKSAKKRDPYANIYARFGIK